MAKRLKPHVGAVRAKEVPEALRDLVPTAKRWDIWNPDDCDELIAATSTDDLRAFVRAIESQRATIDRWFDTLPKDMDKWPSVAERFLGMIKSWNEAACELYSRERGKRIRKKNKSNTTKRRTPSRTVSRKPHE